MWDLIVAIPDHCLSFYFVRNSICVHIHDLCPIHKSMPEFYDFTISSISW